MVKDYQKYLAELIGTFGLAGAVLALVSNPSLGVAVPIGVGATLGLFVLLIGNVSGCHINPAVSLGQFVFGKIDAKTTIGYLVSQFLGAFLALVLFNQVVGSMPELPIVNDWQTALFETLGTALFCFGIGMTIGNKLEGLAAASAIGMSLGFGIIIAANVSNAFLNPAVALAFDALSPIYVLAPIVGSIIGFGVAKLLKN
ncbi:aquaporin [Candidatus Saccharibacteria bacterium]|nr:aquaporin [Candidatus Saccharibacteria bacterium]MCB9834945.1 aquaporin [Candidatus Nomurabacteria bacterium]